MKGIRFEFFLVYAIYGAVLPFLPLVLRSRGFSDAAINFNLGALGLAALAAPLLVAHLADTKQRPHLLMSGLLVSAAATALIWAASRSQTVLFCATLLFFSAYLPVTATLDTVTLRSLGASARERFQSYRVFGSVGFMVPALIFAVYQPAADRLALPFVTAIIMLGVFAALFALRLNFPAMPSGGGGAPSRLAFRASLKPPLADIIWPLTLTGTALSLFYVSFPRYLQELGASPAELGLIYNIGVAAEVAAMPFTGKLVQRFGARRIVATGVAATILRLLLLAAVPSYPVVFVTQLLHAPIVIGFLVVVPALLQEHADDSFRYSIQSLYMTLMIGIARTIGPWLSAVLLHVAALPPLEGLRFAFLCSSGGATLGLAWLALGRRAAVRVALMSMLIVLATWTVWAG